MATPGVAPKQTPNRTLIGPVSTQSGFQYWYLCCFPDRIIAVQQSMGAFFAFGLSNGAVPRAFGLLGLLINNLAKACSQSFRARTEPVLQRTPVANLRVKGNVEFPISQLRSITFRNPVGGGNLILPSLNMETANGNKQSYSVQRLDFEKACEQLKQMYPSLCR